MFEPSRVSLAKATVLTCCGMFRLCPRQSWHWCSSFETGRMFSRWFSYQSQLLRWWSGSSHFRHSNPANWLKCACWWDGNCKSRCSYPRVCAIWRGKRTARINDAPILEHFQMNVNCSWILEMLNLSILQILKQVMPSGWFTACFNDWLTSKFNVDKLENRTRKPEFLKIKYYIYIRMYN